MNLLDWNLEKIKRGKGSNLVRYGSLELRQLEKEILKSYKHFCFLSGLQHYAGERKPLSL